MLQGKNLTFIRAELIEGVSKHNKEYSICNITLSDGLESFKLNMQKEVMGFISAFKKGDKVNIEIDVVENYNRNDFIVTNVQGALQKV